ncbi:unnamed protein product [Rhizophagus irregularis]|nr:unnamed protein product [Rhizophagus irregularis]
MERHDIIPAHEMKMADETKEYYSGTESVNYDDDDGYVYSSESSSCDSSDNDDTVVDDREGKSHAKDALYNLRYNLKLNNEEKECIEKLKGLLKNVDMTLDDFKLLHEVKSKSNMMFHRNNQVLKAAKLQLNDTVPDGVKNIQASYKECAGSNWQMETILILNISKKMQKGRDS